MKNGFINKNNEKINELNSSNNIEIKGFRLKDYIEIIYNNLISLILQCFSYINFGFYLGSTLSNTHEYINLSLKKDANRANYIGELILLNDDNIEILKNYNYCELYFSIQLTNHSNVDENKYIKCQVVRENQIFYEETQSTYSQANSNTTLNMFINYLPQKGDKIYLSVYGTTNDQITRGRFKIKLQKVLRNMYKL